MAETYRCHDCHMTFGTIQLLQKHKQKFCVGGSVGDPDSLLLRRGLRSADAPVGRSVSPDERVRQLKALKQRQEKLRDVRNLEERILLDALEDSDQMFHGRPTTRRSRSRLPLSKDREVQKLQLEYERIRALEQMQQPDLVVPSAGDNPHPPIGRDTRLGAFSVMSNTSMSIHFADDEYQRYNPNQDAQLRQLAENHGRQMEYLQLRNRDLEKQKEDIRRRLEELGAKGRPSGDDQAALLAELRAQEERNQRALEDLRRQLYEINHKRVNVIKIDTICDNLEYTRKLLDTIEGKFLEDQRVVRAKYLENLHDTAVQVSEMSLAPETYKLHMDDIDKNMGKCGEENEKLAAVESDHLREEDSGTSEGSHRDIGLEQKYAEFKRKIKELSNRVPHIKREVEKPTQQPQILMPPPAAPPLPPPPQPDTSRKSYIYPVYYGSSLVAEISAIRQAYLQNGGNDPDVLAQMSQMQAEAQSIEDQMKRDGYDNRHREKKDKDQLKYLEMENDRLHRELLLLQEQNFHARERHKSDREEELERQLRRLQEEQLRKMLELQGEINALKNRSMLEVYRQPPPPPPPQKAEMPALLQRPYVEVEPMAPYDQYHHYHTGQGTYIVRVPATGRRPAPIPLCAGFVIFYDFVLNLDPRVTACRLISGLHSSASAMGEPTLLPTVYTEPATRATYMANTSNAVIGAKQAVPKCPPENDLGIVVELQTSGGPASDYDKHSLITRGWTKLPLFDSRGQLIAGKFRIPFRNVPIKPFLHPSQVQNLVKFDDAELYYRVVNMRDAEVQSMLDISASNSYQYRAPAISPIPPYGKPVTPRVPPPPTASTVISPREQLPVIRAGPIQPQDTTVGFQVDRIKHAENGEGKVRLTAYYASTGKVVQSTTSPVTCSTTAVKSNFKYGYHVFGQQEATFNDVDMQGDMVLIARFYLRKRQQDVDDFTHEYTQEATVYDEETLVAWTAIPLVLSTEAISIRTRRNFNPQSMHVNIGTHILKLYYPPVPEANRIPFEETPTHRDWRRYGKATLKIHIFQGQPRPGSLTPSDLSEDGDDILPEYSWLPCERRTPCKEPFLLGDGFDVYIDGCRFLPDSVTFSKVAGRVLDRKYEVHGRDINTSIKLDSDIYNPVYEEKFEFRETNIPPSSTLLLKLYSIDNFYKQLTVMGYATLNIFVESGTERQPAIDKPGLQVSLNEGAHQLRLYSSGPNGVDPLTESCMRDGGARIVPCASVLVRITKVPKGPSGKALEQSKVPQADWLRLGLHQPRPKYTDRIYFSSKCMPSKGEAKLFHSMLKRPVVTVREAVAKMAKAKESFHRSDKNVDEYIRNKLTKGEAKPPDLDLTFICQYSPKLGIKVAVDSALNLPWSNFTHAQICLNPPGAFYMGAPHATYDKLMFTEMLDMKTTNTSPSWKDGFKHFPRRAYHRFLTVIIHLQEVQVSVAKDNYKYGLLDQAWTAVQVFTDKYCHTATFQLPLYQGSPSPQMLKQLAREPCREWMERNIRSGSIYLIEGASVFVRLADGRRDDELSGDVPGNKLFEVNTDYIPPELEEQYTREKPGKVLEAIVPSGKSPDQFVDGLAIKFKNLVYKLYEEGNLK